MIRINCYSVRMVREKSVAYNADTRMIKSPADVADLIRDVLKPDEYAEERFGIVTLTTKNAIAGIHEISVGALSSTVVHPREAFKPAVLNNAAAIITFHNHPSGDVTPSPEDTTTFTRLNQAGEILGIKVLDHLIYGANGKYLSAKESGLM